MMVTCCSWKCMKRSRMWYKHKMLYTESSIRNGILYCIFLHFVTGWESVFYVMGGLTMIWCVLWVVLVRDSPQEQKLMTDEERTMILTALGDSRNQKHTVGTAIFTYKNIAISVGYGCSRRTLWSSGRVNKNLPWRKLLKYFGGCWRTAWLSVLIVCALTCRRYWPMAIVRAVAFISK